MANSQIPWSGFRPDTRMLGLGASLIGAGALLGAAGAGVLLATLTRAGRSWMNSWEVPPSELAARRLRQAQTAAQAGRDAWNSHTV